MIGIAMKRMRMVVGEGFEDERKAGSRSRSYCFWRQAASP
jgi:hypothetical protein